MNSVFRFVTETIDNLFHLDLTQWSKDISDIVARYAFDLDNFHYNTQARLLLETKINNSNNKFSEDRLYSAVDDLTNDYLYLNKLRTIAVLKMLDVDLPFQAFEYIFAFDYRLNGISFQCRDGEIEFISGLSSFRVQFRYNCDTNEYTPFFQTTNGSEMALPGTNSYFPCTFQSLNRFNMRVCDIFNDNLNLGYYLHILLYNPSISSNTWNKLVSCQIDPVTIIFCHFINKMNEKVTSFCLQSNCNLRTSNRQITCEKHKNQESILLKTYITKFSHKHPVFYANIFPLIANIFHKPILY